MVHSPKASLVGMFLHNSFLLNFGGVALALEYRHLATFLAIRDDPWETSQQQLVVPGLRPLPSADFEAPSIAFGTNDSLFTTVEPVSSTISPNTTTTYIEQAEAPNPTRAPENDSLATTLAPAWWTTSLNTTTTTFIEPMEVTEPVSGRTNHSLSTTLPPVWSTTSSNATTTPVQTNGSSWTTLPVVLSTTSPTTSTTTWVETSGLTEGLAATKIYSFARELTRNLSSNLSHYSAALVASERAYFERQLKDAVAEMESSVARNQQDLLAASRKQHNVVNVDSMVRDVGAQRAMYVAATAAKEAVAAGAKEYELKLRADANDVLKALRGAASTWHEARNDSERSAARALAAWKQSHDALTEEWGPVLHAFSRLGVAGKVTDGASRAILWDAQESRLSATEAAAAQVRVKEVDATVQQAAMQADEALRIATHDDDAINRTADAVDRAVSLVHKAAGR